MGAFIEINGLDAAIAQVQNLRDLKRINDALTKGALYLKAKMATYPPKKRPSRQRVYGATFQSAKQRRGFFAKLNAGAIDVPYRRGISPGSETLGRRWTVASRGPTTLVIGNNASYARLVQARDKQTKYHQVVGWQTAEDVTERETAQVVREVEAQLSRHFGG